jgi:hypothetical protein
VDRAVLNRLDRDDFIAAAREVEAALADSVIDAAISQLPPPYVALERDRLAGGLRARRRQLVEYAEEYYRSLARDIEVRTYAGHADVVELTRLDGERVRLRIRSGDGSGPVTFERVIDARDTKTVRLFVDERQDAIVDGDDLPVDVEIVSEKADR